MAQSQEYTVTMWPAEQNQIYYTCFIKDHPVFVYNYTAYLASDFFPSDYKVLLCNGFS